MKGSSPYSMSVGEALRYITSGDTVDLRVKDTPLDELWEKITVNVKNNWIAGCGSRGASDPAKDGIPNEYGIVPMHAYSILSSCVVQHGGHDARLLKLRNT